MRCVKFWCCAVSVAAGLAAAAAEFSAGHLAAAAAFLEAKGTPRLLERNCRLVVEKQLAASPELADHRAELEKFYNDIFGFAALKEDLTRMYAAEFSEAELRRLAEFYSTPLGRKLALTEEKLVPEIYGLMERRAAEKVKAAQRNK